MENADLEYVGFWARLGASLVDTILLCLVTYPLLIAIYGWPYFRKGTGVAGFADFMLSWVVPLTLVMLFWMYRQATPGKSLFSARVVDAATGKPLTLTQGLVRYFGYFVSSIPLGLGFLWVAFDRRKQGWHDKMAGTVVVRERYRGPDLSEFSRKQ